MSFDLILHGGRVVDPAQGIDDVMDVAFKDGRVAELGKNLPFGVSTESRDVSGCVVTPGLIDLHTHVYWGGTSLGVDPVAYCDASAVTTCIDTGSAGPGNFAGFRAHVIEPCPVRILAYLHVSHAGIFGFSNRVMVGESEDVRLMNPVEAARVADANRDTVVGIKVRVGRHASGDQGITPLDYALQTAEEVGMPLMAHIDEPPPSYEDVIGRLRPGDVLTHAFRPFPNAPCTADGQVKTAVRAARERGVIFDIGHGKGSFAFKTARAMLEGGFPPDVISSDVHALCIDGPAFDQVTTMTKFLHLGMSLADVVRASTEAPAKALGRRELGSLEPGTPGDASVLAIEEGAFRLTDVVGETVETPKRVVAKGVALSGVWRDPKPFRA